MYVVFPQLLKTRTLCEGLTATDLHRLWTCEHRDYVHEPSKERLASGWQSWWGGCTDTRSMWSFLQSAHSPHWTRRLHWNWNRINWREDEKQTRTNNLLCCNETKSASIGWQSFHPSCDRQRCLCHVSMHFLRFPWSWWKSGARRGRLWIQLQLGTFRPILFSFIYLVIVLLEDGCFDLSEKGDFFFFSPDCLLSNHWSKDGDRVSQARHRHE